jgi:2-C-methyl-D-erythritol 4-phosphate cytidylyltransferase
LILTEKIDAIIVAAGSGTRLGFSMPKAFVPLHGKPILLWSLKQFLSFALVDKVILVVPEDLIDKTRKQFDDNRITVIRGGDYRWVSVYNGVCQSKAQWVLVHDAARPFVNHTIIDDLVKKRSEFDCVITVTPEVDTIKEFKADRAGTTIDRSKVVRVGTPQLFRRSVLLDGFKAVPKMDNVPTDEAMLMERTGIEVGIAWGDPLNFKITTPSDFRIAEALLEKDKSMCMGPD